MVELHQEAPGQPGVPATSSTSDYLRPWRRRHDPPWGAWMSFFSRLFQKGETPSTDSVTPSSSQESSPDMPPPPNDRPPQRPPAPPPGTPGTHPAGTQATSPRGPGAPGP